MSADFNAIARLYRYLEYSIFGPALWRRRIAYLPKLAGAKRVLMAGEGDGRFLAAFLEANPEAVVDYVDASSAMLRLARRRVTVRAEGRVRFVRADVLQATFDGRGYDAIVTHFFFDCFCDEELRAVGERLAAGGAAGSVWVVSEFQTKRLAQAVLVRWLYFCFRWLTGLRTTHLPSHRQVLHALGYDMAAAEEAAGGLLVSEVWRRKGSGGGEAGDRYFRSEGSAE
jgi:ubiquinone/menaquinone biosynthesis C-methylase UbiE